MNKTAPHYGRRIAFLRGFYRMTQGQLGEQSGFKQQEVSEFEGKAELADEVLVACLRARKRKMLCCSVYSIAINKPN